MNKQFQKIKVFMLILTIFGSSFIIVCSIAKSGPMDQIYRCTPNLVIEYDKSLLREPILPFDEPRTIPVKLKLYITGPADNIVLNKIGGNIKLIIDLSIAEVPEGCYASITPPIVLIPLPNTPKPVYENATISITINQYLPAASQKKVAVRMNSRKIGKQATLISAGNFTQEIPFIVGYLPQLSFVYIDGNIRNIKPDETAEFTFEIQNWGNAVTKVVSEIENLPEGWLSEIVHSTILGSDLVGSTYKKTISLRVKPPIDFGYHEDRAIIKVSMTPINYGNPEDKGEPHYLYFIVQSKGFSTPGFDVIILLLAFIFVLFPVWKRKNRKIEKKTIRR